MPTLLELQRAVAAGLRGRDQEAAAAFVRGDGFTPGERLSIYRNTLLGVLTNALGLAYPAVRRLVGDAFFDVAAQAFIEQRPPASAYLNEYGQGFADFLAGFPPAASLPYLPDVARLERSVNRALHASDAVPLALADLSEVAAALQARIVLTPHPSLDLLRLDYPADAIWRAVLSGDEDALARVDPSREPVWLMVERSEQGVDVTRMTAAEWDFTEQLVGGTPLGEALDRGGDFEPSVLLAGHLLRGRFVSFTVPADPRIPSFS